MRFLKFCIATSLVITAFSACKKEEPSPQAAPSNTQVAKPTQVARFCISDDLSSLDPRKVRGLNSFNIIRLLYEGLSSTDEHGQVKEGIAQSIDISEDHKTYTFHLQKTQWSNGEPLTAHDFEYSWKSILSRKFAAPYAYQLYVIDNAKRAHEGFVSLDAVGIKALDDYTLQVTLENPTPYFLQLLATPPFFPVSQTWVENHVDFRENNQPACVSNGPFKLDTWKAQQTIEFVKNSLYHNQSSVKLDALQFSVLDDTTALSLFEKNELDWAGSPTSSIPTDALQQLKQQGILHTRHAAGTQFLRVNVNKSPLENVNLRKALALAINRQALVDHVMQANQLPATSFVPSCMGLEKNSFFSPFNPHEAVSYLEQALKEMGIEKSDLAPITLSYAADSRNHKIAQALQQDIKSVLDIDIILAGTEAKTMYENINNQNYQLALGGWFADFLDPISFLSVFQYKDNGTNNTNWENPKYTELLEQSSIISSQTKRFELLQEAQGILLNEMPMIPLFHYSFAFVKNPHFENAHISELGYLEIKEAFFSK